MINSQVRVYHALKLMTHTTIDIIGENQTPINHELEKEYLMFFRSTINENSSHEQEVGIM